MAREDSEPAVIILGGGQSGLEVAARLQLLGVSTLIIEKRERIGDQWRGRYEALCLHDPVCEYLLFQNWKKMNRSCYEKGTTICHTSRRFKLHAITLKSNCKHIPSFPPSWPVWTPAPKVRQFTDAILRTIVILTLYTNTCSLQIGWSPTHTLWN